MTGNREVLTMKAADAVDKAIAEIADFDLKVEGATRACQVLIPDQAQQATLPDTVMNTSEL